MTVWRSNLLGSSGKGHEYFLKHLLGTAENEVRAEESPPELRPQEVDWHEQAPEGKLDLLTTIDFRMTSNALYSDIVLPAATWYEKYDLSTTDLHPFVHAFNQAVPPPWENKSDWDTFARISERFSELAERHLGVRRDVIAAPLLHDTPDEIAQPLGEVRDWRAGECEPVPGKTMPKLIVVDRDYPSVGEKWRAIGPLVEELGTSVKGAHWIADEEIDELRAANGAIRGGVADGRPSIERVEHACEAILRALGNHQRAPRRAGLRVAGGDHRGRAGRSRRHARRRPDHVPGHADPAAHRDHLAGVVGDRGPRSPLLAVHDQRRAREALAHALGPSALLPRPRLDARARRGPADVPPAARPPGDLRRPGRRRRLGAPRADPALPDPALEVVDPLRVPGQPAHADPVPRRRHALDQPRGCRGAGDRRQRLGRGLQPQRRGRLPRDRLPPDPRGDLSDVPRQGPPPRRAADRDRRQARRDRQLADPDRDEADPFHRRLFPAQLRLQLLRADRLAAGRGDRAAQTRDGGDVPNEDPRPGRDGDEPRQVHRLPYLLGDLQAGLDQPAGSRVHVVQRRRDEAGPRLSEALGGSGAVARRLGARSQGPAAAAGRRAGQEAAEHLLQPRHAADRRLLRALDLRLRAADLGAAVGARPGRAAPIPSSPASPSTSSSGARTGTTTSPVRRSGSTRTRSPTGSRSRSRPPTRRRSCSTCRGSASTA